MLLVGGWLWLENSEAEPRDKERQIEEKAEINKILQNSPNYSVTRNNFMVGRWLRG